ncbi:methyltransferase [Vibrio gangliei]|uniref:methyltransferase n=1 Tax=Vibrio gangliei TaxID=2077090 RepID=UPI000D016D93|nr:methyltransferase [Vibrio gangliei]
MDSNLKQRFRSLDQALLAQQHFWRIEPFHLSEKQQSPWPEHGDLFEFIQTLTAADIEKYKTNNDALISALEPYIPDLQYMWQQCELPSFESRELPNIQHHPNTQHLSVGIPGRKWQQISAMGMAALHITHHHSWLEWCAGKGYLGQWLAQQSFKPVVSFEWQKSLCEAGQDLADKHGLPMTFVQGDALSEQCTSVFEPTQHAVALHACGDLHAHLIQHVCDFKLAGATISPCCYHLIQTDHYQPLSQLGQESQLCLSKHDLRIPLQETVTGGERVSRHRELEMTYRLAFDSLLKHLQQTDEYLPIPSIKKSLLSEGFEFFCHWAIEQKQLNVELPNTLTYWFEQGQTRFLQMERLSLVQQVFRRPLEMWLVCDKALRLQQSGYDVSLSIFCSRDITPRNILIQAIQI